MTGSVLGHPRVPTVQQCATVATREDLALKLWAVLAVLADTHDGADLLVTLTEGSGPADLLAVRDALVALAAAEGAVSAAIEHLCAITPAVEVPAGGADSTRPGVLRPVRR